MKDDLVYFQHILEATKKIDQYTADLKFAEFSRSTLLQDGVMRELEIIGEAVKRISATTKKLDPDIPWKEITGMRDKLIHDYFGVDIEAVWKTAKQDVPQLRKRVEQLIK